MRKLCFSALAILLLLSTSCARHASGPRPGSVLPVQIASVRLLPLMRTLAIPGRVTRQHTALLASREGGFITASPVKAGTFVRSGTVLAVVGQAGARARLAQAHDRLIAADLNLKEAERQDRRYRSLEREGAVSVHEYQNIHRRFEIAQAEARAADAGWRAAWANLSYARIRAPFSGLLVRRFLHQGSFAPPGAPLLRLVGGASEVRTAVAEKLYRRLRIGERVQVRINGRVYPARIVRLVNAIDPATETHEVTLLLPARGPQPAYGALATIFFPIGRRPTLVIPQSALIRRSGLEGVFLVNPKDQVFFQQVRPRAQTQGSMIAIAAGLKAGDRIVVHPTAHVENGTRIVPAPSHA